MDQRRLRLGDILDDYCPRERRVTNHAVVAMIEEDVKQTRCTTCDSEHAYKGARVPKRRKKETPAALYQEVLAAMPEAEQAPVLAAPVREPEPLMRPDPDELPLPQAARVDDRENDPAAAPASDPRTEDSEPPMHSDERDRPDDSPAPPTPVDDEVPAADGPVHRPLIRATLPRPEGQKDARPVPEFTVRHAPARGSGNGHGHRGAERVRMRANGFGNAQREANGNRPQGPRFHGNRSAGSGRPQGGRPGSPGFRHGSPNGKRGRGSRG